MRSFLLITLAFALAAACLALPGGFGSPVAAEASHGRICGAIAKGNNDYLVVAKRVGCKRGRKGVARYLDKRKPLRGFSCNKNVGQYAFVCKGSDGSYRAEKL